MAEALIKQEMTMIKDITMGPLQQTSRAISSYFPQVLGALGILVVGWLVAIILRKITGKTLRALGLDVISERTGMTDVLQRGSIRKRPSELIGTGIYWLILFSALVATFNTLGLNMASMLLQSIVTYIPHLLIALLLLSLGFFASRYIDTLVTATATAVDLPAPHAWGRVAQSLILFMAGIMALGELDISTQIFSFSFLVLLGVAGIAAAVAFGLGTRSVVEQLAAGQGLRQCLQPGEVIQYDCHEGTIEAVGYTHINLRTDQGIVVIPNTVMLNATIIKRRSIAATPVTTHTSKAKQPV
jgi:hypothetical protein